MKKTRLIAFVMIIAIMAVGAGYAAWQDTLVINETVKTGTLDMKWNWGFCISTDLASFINIPEYDIVNNSNTFQATLTNVFPGVWYNIDLEAENTGSIPAILSNVTVDLAGMDEDLQEDIRVYGYIFHFRKGSIIPVHMKFIGKNSIFGSYRPVSLSTLQDELEDMESWRVNPGDKIVFGVPDQEIDEASLAELEEYQQYLASELEGYDPEKNNCLFFSLPLSTDNDTMNLLNQKFEIDFDFKQFNQ
jgi:hypothetical protein